MFRDGALEMTALQGVFQSCHSSNDEETMRTTKKGFAVLFAATGSVLATAGHARAALNTVYATPSTNQAAFDGNIITTNDLILAGHTSTLSSVTAPATNSGFGATGFYDGSAAASSNFSYYDNVAGAGQLPQDYIFTLNTTTSPNGYDISSIQSIAGWGDHSLGNQNFDIFVKTLSNPTFTQVGGDFTNAGLGGTGGSATMTTITDSTGTVLSGVTAIQFHLLGTNLNNQAGSNGGTVYRDVEVIGTASAANLTYDANTAVAGVQDGAAVWDTTTPNFYNSGTGTDVAWSNSPNATAVFGNGGTAGTITVANVTTNAIQFNATLGGYTLTGGTITLAGNVAPAITNGPDTTINSTINSTLGLYKYGAGNLTLGGAINLGTGALNVQAGTLTFAGASSVSGTLFNVGGTTNTVGTMNINTTGSLTFSTVLANYVGQNAGGIGALNQTNGTLNLAGYLVMGFNGGTAHGTYNLSGNGTLNVTGTNPGIVTGWGATGSFLQTGNSTINDAGYFYVGANNNGGGKGVATFSGGTANFGTAGVFATNLGFAASSTGIMNIGTQAGGNAVVTVVGGGMNVGDGSGSTGILNLNSGVLQFNSYFIQQNGGAATSLVNLNGGTLRVGAAGIAQLINPAAAPTVTMYNGGLTVDTNGFQSGLGIPLMAATGNGVYTAGGILAATGLTGGLTGTPLVTVTGGTGTGLSAIANVTGGAVTGFTLTNPGQNYTVGDTVTFTIAGAGASGTTTFTHQLTPADLAANGIGGLTKVGAGTLSLSGVSTYRGATTISAGQLAIGVNNAISSNSSIVMGVGTTLNTGGFNDTVGTLSQAGNTTIDFGTNNAGSILQFANSSSQTWSGLMTILDWNGTGVTGGGLDQLKFGSSAAGLTSAQLSDIKFYGYSAGATILANGEVVPSSTVHTATGLPTFLALGDSITDGRSGNNGVNFYPGGYRDPLYTNLTNAGYQFNYVGTASDNATAKLTAANETLHDGITGARIDQITANINTYLAGSNKAGNILLMLGTNDVAQQYDPGYTGGGFGPNFASDAAGRLTTLISDIYADSPGSTVYVASIIPIVSTAYFGTRFDPSYNAEVQAYNALIQSQVVPYFRGLGDSIVFVDQYDSFVNSSGAPIQSLYGTSDDEHPSGAGYALVANNWSNAILASVPEPGSMSVAMAAGVAGLVGRRRRKVACK